MQLLLFTQHSHFLKQKSSKIPSPCSPPLGRGGVGFSPLIIFSNNGFSQSRNRNMLNSTKISSKHGKNCS